MKTKTRGFVDKYLDKMVIESPLQNDEIILNELWGLEDYLDKAIYLLAYFHPDLTFKEFIEILESEY